MNETPEKSKPTYEQLEQELSRVSAQNQRYITALLDISNDMLKRAKNGKKRVKSKEIKEMSLDEQWEYYDRIEKTWKLRKQSYLKF